MTSPTPIGRQSFNAAAPDAADGTASIPIPQAEPTPSASLASVGEVTGTIPVAPPTGGKPGLVQIPPTEKLPDAIGGPVLRAAALRGDPAAAYEIGVRYERQKEGQEDWFDVPSAVYAGRTDCKVLACWRVAELRRAGIAAEPAFIRYDNPDGTYLFHILTQYPDGTLEDPSAMLGMMSVQQAA